MSRYQEALAVHDALRDWQDESFETLDEKSRVRLVEIKLDSIRLVQHLMEDEKHDRDEKKAQEDLRQAVKKFADLSYGFIVKREKDENEKNVGGN